MIVGQIGADHPCTVQHEPEGRCSLLHCGFSAKRSYLPIVSIKPDGPHSCPLVLDAAATIATAIVVCFPEQIGEASSLLAGRPRHAAVRNLVTFNHSSWPELLRVSVAFEDAAMVSALLQRSHLDEEGLGNVTGILPLHHRILSSPHIRFLRQGHGSVARRVKAGRTRSLCGSWPWQAFSHKFVWCIGTPPA